MTFNGIALHQVQIVLSRVNWARWELVKTLKLKRTLPNSQNVPKVQVKTYLLGVVLSRTVIYVILFKLIPLSEPSVWQVSMSMLVCLTDRVMD